MWYNLFLCDKFYLQWCCTPNPTHVDWHSFYTLGTSIQKSALAHAQLAHTMGLGVKSLLVTYWSSSKKLLLQRSTSRPKAPAYNATVLCVKTLVQGPSCNSMFACRVHREPSFSSQKTWIPVQEYHAFHHLLVEQRTWTPNDPCKKNLGLVTEPPFQKGTGLIVWVSSLHQHRQGLVLDGYQFGGNKPWLLEILQNCTNLRHVHPCSMLILARRNKHGSFLGLATQRSISLFFAKITWEIEDSVIG